MANFFEQFVCGRSLPQNNIVIVIRMNEGISVSKGIALITGAGSGIGQACAIALAREGWETVLTGRRVDALEATITMAGSAGSAR